MKLKSLLTIGVFLIAYAFAYAVPTNDDPCNAAVLSVESTCTYQSFTNVDATATASLPTPACGNYQGGDVWFRFDMPLNGLDVIIDLADNGGITNAAMSVYSGPDCNNLSELICDDNSGAGLMPQLTMDDGCSNSNGGVTYWVRVWEFENDATGTFDICTYEAPTAAPIAGCNGYMAPSNTCCDAVRTSLCEIDGYCTTSATSYTVTPTENVLFCAVIENNSWISFVSNSTDLEFEFVVTNCNSNFGIQAQLFETTNCQDFTIASSCFNPGPGASLDGFLIANNLVPGNTYYLMVDGWASDVCDYTIHVTDLAPEAEVTTVPSTICSGQSTQLNASVFGTGNYTYSWTPTADLSDPTISNPVATPAVTTTYSVEITGLCGGTTSYNVTVTVDPDIPTNLVLSGQPIVCENDLNQDYTIAGNNLVTNNWTVTGGTIVGPSDGTTVNINWGASGGTVCIDASNGCGAAPQECTVVTISPEPSISIPGPVTGCSDPGYNLNDLTINDANNSIGLITFYDNAGAANAGMPELMSDSVTTSGVYWVRKQSAPSCFDVASVVVQIEEPDITVGNPTAVCAPSTVDLSTATVTDANGLSGTNQYYPTEPDAENLTNELASTVVSSSGTYWIRFTTSNGCVDIASVVATINPTPDLSAMETSFCEGVGLDLASIPYTDANNTTITTELYYDNYTSALTELPGFALSNTVVQDSGYYYLLAETAAGCSDIVELHTVFGQTPEGSLSGTDDICSGDSIYVSFNLLGTPPFDVVYTDGTSNFTLTGITNGHVEPIEVNANTTFTLTSVTNGTCQGTVNNGAVTATVTNSATADISGTTAICTGNSTDITFNVNALGLFDLILSDGTDLDTLENIADGYNYTVAPTSNTTYTVVEVIDNNYPSCDVNYSGSVAIDVNTESDTTSVQFVCNNTGTQYQVVIDITGGDPSTYVVNGDPGTLVGTQFTSSFINTTSPYSFVVTDGGNCNPVTVAGTYACPCVSDAGQLTINAMEFCPGDLFVISHNNQEVLDANDVFGYILHDSPTTTIGNVVATNNNGMFAFDANTMTYGTTYYVSPVVGNDDGTGFPVLDINLDPCLSVAVGNPVTFLRPSEVVLSGGQTLCPGESATLTLSYDAPINIDVVIFDGTNYDTHTNVGDGYQFQVSPTSNTNYTIFQATTTDPIYCDIEVDGSAMINVNLATDTSSVQILCNNTATQYQVVIDITGGFPANYIVNGDPGTIVGSTFTSAPINSSSPYSFVVTDNNDCNPVIVTGTHTCPCISDAGSIVISAAEYCPGDAMMITHDGQEILDGDDAFGYILHDSPAATIGNVIDANNTGVFTFDGNTMNYGTTYYVSAVVANNDGSGMPILDISTDACLSVTAGTPVTFLRPSEVTLTGSQALCNGSDATLTINYDAPIPIDVIIYDGTNFQTLSNVGDGYQFQVSPTTNTTYTISQATTTNPIYCAIDIAGSAVVDVNNAPDTSSVQIVCNNTATQYQVLIYIAGGDFASYAVNGDAGTLAGSLFTSTFINSGTPYSFVVTDGNNCNPITVNGTHECPCITDAGAMVIDPAVYCDDEVISITHNNQEILDGDDAFGFVMHDSPTSTLGNIIGTSNSGAFTFDATTMTYGVTYYVSAIAGNDDGSGAPVTNSSLDPCLSITEGTPVSFLRSSEVTLVGGETLCLGDASTLTVNYDAPTNIDIIVSDGTTNDTFENVMNGFQFDVSPSMTSTYTIIEATTTNSDYCAVDMAGSALINTISRAIPDNVQLICNSTNTEFQVVFNIIPGDAVTYSVNGDAGNLDLATNTFTSNWIPNNGSYSFSVEDSQGCPPFLVDGTHYCECTTDAGTIGSIDDIACEGTAHLVYTNNDYTLDGDDVLGYVLHDGTATTIGNPLFTNLTGTFNYDPILVYGQTYYVTAVVSNDDGTGFPNLDPNLDPCYSASEGLPVTFHPIVMAGISAPDSICSNVPIPVTFHFDGLGLYNVEFFDGTSIITLENLLNGYVQSFEYTTDAQFYLVSVNTGYCEGTLDPSATTVDVEVFPTAEPVDLEVTCLMDTAYVISFDIIGGDLSTLNVTGNPGTLIGRTFVSDPIVNNTPYTFTIDDDSICEPIELVGIHNCSCDPNMAPYIDVNNRLTCTNQVDGEIEVIHPNNGGVAPYTYTWSSGSSDKSLTDVGPGVYYVTIADANGCIAIDSIEFLAPEPIEAIITPEMPTCPGDDDGVITVFNVSGGSGNYDISIDGGFKLSDSEYVGFGSGSYMAQITDDIGCSWEQEILVDEPEPLDLNLGIDTLISIGDSIRLLPVTNGFVDTFMWSQDQILPCPTCYSQVVYPTTSTAYELTIVDPDGCQTTDQIIIRVDDERPVYIPNVFHPNGDGKNDMFTAFGGHVVEEIVSMQIFDRWGEQMHSSGGYPPNDENFGWDGTFNGMMMDPGAYIYVIEIRFTDGTFEQYKGDISIIR